jgi:hypothetical protein
LRCKDEVEWKQTSSLRCEEILPRVKKIWKRNIKVRNIKGGDFMDRVAVPIEKMNPIVELNKLIAIPAIRNDSSCVSGCDRPIKIPKKKSHFYNHLSQCIAMH